MVRIGRSAGLVVCTAVVALLSGCGSDDDGTTRPSDTLGSMSPDDVGVATPSVGTTGTASTVTTGGTVGEDDPAGVVSLQVRIAATGVDELIELDRATLDAAAVDPISLDAVCTSLDGGDGLTVAVTDLRRVATGHRLVSATLRVEDDVAGAGEYQGTIDIGDTQQVVTSYAGVVRVDAGLATGTFDMVDAAGRAATGTFACAAQAVAATTTTTTSTTTTTIPLATS